MRNQLLRDSDVMSMAWSLELRVPFIDRVLFEKVNEIPSSLRLQSGKKLLLDALPEIPQWIRDQRKRGFMFPFARWGVAQWVDAGQLRHRYDLSGETSWYQLWCLFVFESWWERVTARAT
jgi:asparagine synthase (glutamine-hydrolysing)